MTKINLRPATNNEFGNKYYYQYDNFNRVVKEYVAIYNALNGDICWLNQFEWDGDNLSKITAVQAEWNTDWEIA
jgi:hypothetical protein